MQRQLDGAGAADSSDDDGSDISDDAMDDEEDMDDADDKDDDDDEVDGDGVGLASGGAEEEPLNSEDDVTDEDASDLFDTENVIVCQYDKVSDFWYLKFFWHLANGNVNVDR